jgi:hypothetical protein
MRTRRPQIDFTALWDCAARIGGATVRWRESMRLEVTDAEVAEAARELSWRHPEARTGRS